MSVDSSQPAGTVSTHGPSLWERWKEVLGTVLHAPGGAPKRMKMVYLDFDARDG